ncbi:MAG: glycosyltransferase [Bacteroidaceae bacterium]|nr:glycosyltransferase [Bacteroidaceae bacterium]
MEKLSQDFEIYLVANIKDSHEVEGLPLTGYKAIRIERRPNPWADLRALWQLYRYIKQEQFFVVQAQASKPSLLTAIASWMARVPHRIRIFTGQLWCDMKGAKRYFFKSIDRLTVKLNTELLADGRPQARYLAEQGILKPSQIQVLANGSICGIDLERFRFDEQTRIQMRQTLNISEKVVYIFLGRLKRDKGIQELLEAFNNLATECPNAVLLLVGRDEQSCHSWLPKYANLRENENVIFYGFTPRPNDLLMAGDVFCLPSYREGFGLSVLEASCLGLPVICSDTYGMEDTMVEGVTGLRCKVRDAQSLYDCMKRLYGNEKLRKDMGQSGHERVVRDFSRDLVTNAWYDFYKSLK